MARNCWCCGRFIERLFRHLCGECWSNGNSQREWWYNECILFGVKKSEVIDHSKVYAPNP